ncbi:MAG: hypothetical protein Q8P92_05200 [Candidatus Daviesbacteria bacterium]|nr:hypothetical protein [Candidatus Daviesbacteria bacterium]
MTSNQNPESLQLTPLTSLSEFMTANLQIDEEKREGISPVGIILYADKSKMVLIGSRTNEKFKGALVCSYQDTPEGFDPSLVIDGKNRIIDLSDYHELKVAQVTFGGADINTYRSIRTLPSVIVRMHTQNPMTNQEEIVNVDEEELLRIFTGEAGGIAVFSGASLTEENALVVDKDTQDKKSGLVFFMHPDTDPTTGFDSVAGLYSFLRNLNKEFIDTPRYPLQAQSLHAFDFGLKDGLYDFGGIEVREELFRTQVIANTRLAARLHQPRYQEFLNSHLPDVNTPAWASFVRRILMIIGIKDTDFKQLANRSIDRLILGEDVPDETLLLPEPKQQKDNNFFLKLRTTKARDIWQQIGDKYTNYWYSRSFIANLVDLIAEAESLYEIEDGIISLQRLGDSSFKNINFGYKLDIHAKEKRIKWSDAYSNEHKGEELLQYLMAEALEKKKQIEASIPMTF